MWKFYIILIVLPVILHSCKPEPEKQQIFEINHHEISLKNEDIYRIYYYKGVVIGRYFDHTVFAIDSNFNHVKALEDKLNSIPAGISDIEVYKDDLLVINSEDQLFVFDTAYNRKLDVEEKLNILNASVFLKINDTLYLNQTGKRWHRLYGDYLYETIDVDSIVQSINTNIDLHLKFGKSYIDNEYIIFSNSACEFEHYSIFYNRLTGKTFCYPTSGDIFKVRGAYYLLHNYSYYSEYIRIPNPSKLPYASVRNNEDPPHKEYRCDIICINDSLEREYLKSGVDIYFDSLGIQTLTNFIHDSSLYSVCASDSSFILIQHLDTVEYLAYIPRKYGGSCEYFSKQEINTENVTLTVYSGPYIRMPLESKRYHNGFVLIRGNKIDICESGQR